MQPTVEPSLSGDQLVSYLNGYDSIDLILPDSGVVAAGCMHWDLNSA